MSRQLYIIVYMALLWFLFLGVPDSVIYNNSNVFFKWLPFVLVFFALPLVLYKIIQTFDVQQRFARGMAAASVLIVGAALGIFIGAKQDKELSEHGKTRECNLKCVKFT